MLIVSQDKTEIVNFDNIENIWINTESESRFTIEATADTNSTLGYYKTEERAKEILLNISIQYALNKMTQSINFKPNNENGAGRYMPVYEMPEK